MVHLVRQDLSIAGKRAGLAGARSGLYMEQIRIIREMREHDRTNGRTGEFIRPRYMVWENVPGAFSSNKGEDFGAVLHETIRIVCPKAPPVSVPKNGWPTSGCIVGDEWSLAWRVLDAQFWGVPQRRRRIALVADFAGQSAPEILFEREIVSGDSEPGEAPREGTSGAAAAGTYPTIARSITSRYDGSPCIDRGPNIVFCMQGNGIDRADTAGCNGKGWREDVSYTLNTIDRPAVCAGFKLGNSEQARSIGYAEELSPTLNAECGGNKPTVVYSLDSLASNSMKSPNPNSGCREVEIAKTLDTTSPDPSKNQGGIAILDMSHANDVIRECGDVVPTLQSRMGTGGNQVPLAYGVGNGQLNEAQCMATEKAQTLNTMHDAQEVMQNMAVRRLTPLECERLQGFPDGWTDIGAWIDEKGKLHKESSDSARYRAIGNSIALPPWKWVLKRLCAQYERDATLGSLFDGLAGFPLLWMQLNGWNSVKWASEIEPFCIAVTKRHFGDEKNPGDAWKYLMEDI